MKYWLDTEFIERPHTIDLISVGIVGEDDSGFYMESSDVDWSQASQWVLENVRPHLTGPAYPRDEIRQAVLDFIGEDKPEFWGYYADYDWVVFCWLFGTMMELPKGWPMYCRDIKQWADTVGNPRLPEQTSTEHNALADAQWNRRAWEFLRGRYSR
jgi:3'-5' exoribonuclease-like protein